MRRSPLRVPLRGSLTLQHDPGSGRFTGNLVLDPSTATRSFLGVRLVSSTVQITAGSPVTGRIGADGAIIATVTVQAVITAARVAGWTLISGGSCRTRTHATVPLRSGPAFPLEQGGQLTGRYDRPPFTGCGWVTPLVNLLISGPGNTVVIDLRPAP